MELVIYNDTLSRFTASLDVSERSRQTYRQGAQYFIDWIKRLGISAPKRQDAISFKEWMMKQYKPTTVSTYLQSAKRLFEWLNAEGLYPNIFADIKGAVTSRRHRKNAVTADGMRSVMDTFDTTTSNGMRNYAMTNLAARTGMRTIELQRADVDDIDFKDGQRILWVHGKGKSEKDEFVVLTDAAWEPIELYLQSRPSKSKVLFARNDFMHTGDGERLSTRMISGIIKEALVKAGFDSSKYTAHSMRHTAVTLALQGGANVVQVQAMARHANINTTMIYAHDIGRVANAAERAVEF